MNAPQEYCIAPNYIKIRDEATYMQAGQFQKLCNWKLKNKKKK